MPIKEVRAIPYMEMLNLVQNNRISFPESSDPVFTNIEDIYIISITDHDLPKIFKENSEKILTLIFSDIDPQNINFVPPKDSHFFKPEQAVEVVDFIERINKIEKNILLLVNCKYGQCRSGAIIDFVANIYGLGFWETHRKNPQIVPNYWVRYLLLNEFFKKKYTT